MWQSLYIKREPCIEPGVLSDTRACQNCKCAVFCVTRLQVPNTSHRQQATRIIQDLRSQAPHRCRYPLHFTMGPGLPQMNREKSANSHPVPPSSSRLPTGGIAKRLRLLFPRWVLSGVDGSLSSIICSILGISLGRLHSLLDRFCLFVLAPAPTFARDTPTSSRRFSAKHFFGVWFPEGTNVLLILPTANRTVHRREHTVQIHLFYPRNHHRYPSTGICLVEPPPPDK